jgi:hypothetical protein
MGARHPNIDSSLEKQPGDRLFLLRIMDGILKKFRCKEEESGGRRIKKSG